MHKNDLLKALPGTANLKARKLYHTLKNHFTHAACTSCIFYKQYGVFIVRGDFCEHIEDLNDGKLAAADIFKLKDAGLIELEEITARQYRLTICELAPEEAIA
jgi:hypothetical protein